MNDSDFHSSSSFTMGTLKWEIPSFVRSKFKEEITDTNWFDLMLLMDRYQVKSFTELSKTLKSPRNQIELTKPEPVQSDRYERKYRALRADYDQLIASNHSMKNQILDLNTSNIHLQKAYDKSKSKNFNSNSEYRILQDKYEKLLSDYNKTISNLKQLQKASDNLEAENREYAKESEEWEADYSDLDKKYNDLDQA